MEGFLKHLKGKYINCPDVITKENVNIILYHRTHNQIISSFLKESLRAGNDTAIKLILTLQPTITYWEIISCSDNIIGLKLILETNVDLNGVAMLGDNHVINFSPCGFDRYFDMLIDYGSDMSYMQKSHSKEHFDYANLVKCRISTCRKTLLALIRVRKGSRSLRGLRGVILEIAKQVWTQRGGEGCGPRGKRWVY
jgi:hypothetical protein